MKDMARLIVFQCIDNPPRRGAIRAGIEEAIWKA